MPTNKTFGKPVHEFGPFYKDSKRVIYLHKFGLQYYIGKPKISECSFSNFTAGLCGLGPLYYDIHNIHPGNFKLAFANYETGCSTLFKFSIDAVQDYKQPTEDFGPVLVNNGHKLKFPFDLRYANEKDILQAKIKPKTHPGGVTRKIFMHKPILKKGNIVKQDIVHEVYEDVKANGRLIARGSLISNGSHYIYNGREKINITKVEDEIKSRPLFIPEMADVVINSTGLEHFKNNGSNVDRNSSELGLGHSDAHMGFYRRMEIDLSHPYQFDFDGKTNDARLESGILDLSFDLGRLSFETNNDKINNFFKFMRNGFVSKYFHTPRGHVFHMKHGTATGNVLTSLINSISCGAMGTITLNCCIDLKDFKDDYVLCIQGDDIKLNLKKPLNKEHILSIQKFFANTFNYEVTFNEIKLSFGGNVNKLDINTYNLAPTFLKRFIYKGKLSVQDPDLFEKLVFGPEYAGFSSNRGEYLCNRLFDIPCINDNQRDGLVPYLAFMKLINISEYNMRELYKITFALRIANNGTRDYTLKIVLGVLGISQDLGTKTKLELQNTLELYYSSIYCSYSTENNYKDYGTDTDESFTIEYLISHYSGFKYRRNVKVIKALYGHSG